MPRDIFKTPEEKRLGQIAIAYYYGMGTPIDAIPARLNIKCSSVFIRTYIKKAIDSKMLDVAPRFIPENVDADDFLSFQREYLEGRKLAEKLASWSGYPPTVYIRKSNSLPEFSTATAPCLTKLLEDSCSVGVLGGTTMASLVQVLRGRIYERKEMKVRFTPLSGTCTWVLHNNRHEQDASTISSQLEHVLTHSVDPDAPVLAGVPAYIGTGQNVRAVKDYIESIPGYYRIFAYDKQSRKFPVINYIDTIVTAIGAFWRTAEDGLEAGEYLKERAAQEGIKLEELSKLVCGDIGGHLLIRDGLSKADRKRVEQYNANWMGIKASHFETVASRARRSKKNRPGCIVIAYQPSKAEAIKEAIKLGYVKNLIISDALEKALLALP